MLTLLLAVAGAPLPDRPHWPALPAVHVDAGAEAHERPGCPRVCGATRVPVPTPTPDLAYSCDCLSPLLDSLSAHPAAAELDVADLVLEHLGTVPEAHQVLSETLGTTVPGVLADPAGAAAAAGTAGAKVHWLLLTLARTVHQGQRLAADLAALPWRLAEPARALLAVDLPALQATLTALRGVWDDAALNALAAPELAQEPAPAGHVWLFQAGRPGHAAAVGGPVERIWPGRVHRSADGTKLAMLLPTAVARAWFDAPRTEIVTADPALTPARLRLRPMPGRVTRGEVDPPVHTAEPAELADLSPQQVRAALALWCPSRGGAAPMHALAALRAAAAVLT